MEGLSPIVGLTIPLLVPVFVAAAVAVLTMFIASTLIGKIYDFFARFWGG